MIEQGKAGELRQKAFFQLEELNRRLAEKDWGPVKSQRLKDQLKNAEPLRGDDDKLWDAVDFWSCYIGYVPVPSTYQTAPAPTLTAKRAEELCQKWRQHVRRVISPSRLQRRQRASGCTACGGGRQAGIGAGVVA